MGVARPRVAAQRVARRRRETRARASNDRSRAIAPVIASSVHMARTKSGERAPLLPTGPNRDGDGGSEDVERGDGGSGDVERGDGAGKDVSASLSSSSSSSFGVGALALASTVIWFATNISNNIALQDFHGDMLFDSVDVEPRLEAMTFVTLVQMACGVVMAMVLKMFVPGGTDIVTLLKGGLSSAFIFALGALHGFGSLATNMGFMFGSASFVQIIKLFEPWEMLTIDCVVKHWLGKPLQLSLGVVLSMAMIILSAVSLLVDKMNGGQLIGAVFAVSSGLMITSRIVFQKTFRLTEAKTGFAHSLDEYLLMTFNALLALVAAFLWQFTVSRTAANGVFVDIGDVINLFRVELILFHPLYNLFSLLTLTFVASITHSLLNVSKRVIGLLITLAWFHEEVTPKILCSAGAAFIGGCWYTIEKRGAAAASIDSSCWRLAILERKPRKTSAPL